MTAPAMSAATKIPVPLADSQLNKNTAVSGFGLATTGGTRWTIPSSPGMGNLGAEMPSKMALTCGSPQRKTTTLKMTQGVQARRTSPRLPSGSVTPRDTSRGYQNRSNNVRAAREITAETTSTSQGP